MNERIKELYEQAHIERRQEYFSSVVNPTIKSVSVTRHFDLDLFAELVWKAAYEEGHDVGVDAGFAAGCNASFTEQNFGEVK